MKNKRPHSKLIKAWANGAIIQFRDMKTGKWEDCWDNDPSWDENLEYRIKPDTIEADDMVVMYAWANLHDLEIDLTPDQHSMDNLRLVFDRQHGRLLKAEVIK